jgi:hypothetical protein
VTILAVGTCSITASQAGNAAFAAAAPVPRSFTVNPAGVTTEIVGSVVWDGNPIPGVTVELKGPLSAGNYYTLPTLASAVTASNGSFVITNPPTGSFEIYAVSPDTSVYWQWWNEAITVTAGQVTNAGALTLCKQLQLLSPASGSALSTTTPTLQWQAFPGTTSYYVAVGNVTTLAGVFGQYTAAAQITVTPALSPGSYEWGVWAYDANGPIAYYESWAFTVSGLASQTIAFGALSNVTFGVAPFAIAATASSGLAVTFASTTPSVCSVSGNTVTVLAVGSCSVTASQAGNSSYAAATPVTQSFGVFAAAQTISFGSLSNVTLGVAAA